MTSENFLTVQPCKNRAAWEARPKKPLKLNLPALASHLTETEYQIVVDTPHILIVEKNAIQFTIYPSGRILLDGVTDQNN